MMRNTFIVLLTAVSMCLSANAQDKVVKNVIEMGRNDNRTVEHIDFLANRIGGRPVGSNALTDAENWVKSQFESWGLEVIVQEAGEINVGFNRGPASGRLLAEDGFTLNFGTPIYTAGTSGAVKGHVLLEPRDRKEFEKMKGKIKGAWILLSSNSTGMAINGSEEANSIRDSLILKNEEIARKNEEIVAFNRENKDNPKKLLEYKEYPALFYKDMVEAGALGFIQSAKLPLRILYDRPNCYKITMDRLPKVCDIKLDEHQFEVIRQKVIEKQDFLLEFDIRNHFSIGPVRYHNIIGVIKGSKYPDEYVLMGGHLDSYDIGTGAVDDANGTAVAMEVARMLSASGAKPKRSMMFCIWTAEEYGLLGSKYFVESGLVDLKKISNYFNRDGGPLMATSVIVPPAMYDDFVNVSGPIENYNPEIPFTVVKKTEKPGPRPTKGGGSDYAYFQRNGVPTISFKETDPLGYNFEYGEIWHTENDTFNKIIPEYLEHSTVVTAVIAYGLANLDHLLSREGLYTD